MTKTPFRVAAVWVLTLVPAVLRAQPLTLYNPDQNNPRDQKAILAVVRAANAAHVAPNQLQLFLCNEFNAFYAGNGVFIAGVPLLNALPQWAVDAVMAHEMGHLAYRHVEQRQQLQQGVTEGLAALGRLLDRKNPEQGGTVGGVVGQITATLLEPKFEQPQELEADAYGVVVLRGEGYPQPGNQMISMLAFIENVLGPSGGRSFFDTHPSFEERIARLHGR
jgi:Zn-dependent protease with chaperone function